MSIKSGVTQLLLSCSTIPTRKENSQMQIPSAIVAITISSPAIMTQVSADSLIRISPILHSSINLMLTVNIFVYCCAFLFFDWNNPKEPKGINHAALSGQMINSTKYYDMYYYAHTSDRNGKQYLNGKRQYTSIKDVYDDKYYKNMIVKVCVLR